MFCLLVVCYITIVTVKCQTCNFPSDLRGQWVRSFDFRSVTINSDAVYGFNVKVGKVELSRFQCAKMYRDNIYVIRALLVDPDSIKRKYYYECWRFVKLNVNVHLVHDLSEKLHLIRDWLDNDRTVYDQYESPPFNKVCPRNVTDEPYSIFLRKDVPADRMGVPCPPSLVAHYAPYFMCDKSDLNFCSKPEQGLLSMENCLGVADAMFETAGPLTCVGHVYKCPYVHASLYHLDRVDCFVYLENALDGHVMQGLLYFGDCTMAGRSEVNFPMKWTVVSKCPDVDSAAVNKTRHCKHQETLKHKSTNSAVNTSLSQWLCSLLVLGVVYLHNQLVVAILNI